MIAIRSAPRTAGFTLVELMVVVVIIGILASLAIPRFNVTSHRSKEKEAELILKQVYEMQQTYRAERGAFATNVSDLTEVGFESPGTAQFYNWTNDVNLPLCLSSTGVWSGRRIDADGNITNC